MKDQLNVLWVYLEDVSPWFGCYGDSVAETPFIDGLSEKGLLYKRCYAPSPVCSPSRSALITGTWPSRFGVEQHRSARTVYDRNPLPDGFSSLPERLQRNGYITFNAGKDDYNFTYDREQLYPGAYNSHFHWKESARGVIWEDLQRGQPFFGQIQLLGGKRKNEAEVIELSPSCKKVKIPGYYPDEHVFREAIARHYGCINYVDKEIEGIFNNLEALDILDQTVVFIFSDHGWDGLRDKQFCYEGGTHVPLIVVAPEGLGFESNAQSDELVSSLDISATTLSIAGVKDRLLCDGVDLRDANSRRDHIVSQRDRCDFTLDCIRSVVSKRFRYIRNLCPERPWLQPQYRSQWPEFIRWLELASAGNSDSSPALNFARSYRAEEEFYDLDNDPDQLDNLISSTEFSEEIAQHKIWLKEWSTNVGDRGPYFSDSQLLATLLRWGVECCSDAAYEPVRKSHKELIDRFPEQRPWKLGEKLR